MGALTRISRELIAEKSADPEWLPAIFDRIADGDGMDLIAQDQGVTYGALLRWIRADEDRNSAFLNAQAIAAQKMVDQAKREVDEYEDGKEFRAKLKVDTYLRIAGKLDARFGNGPNVAVQGTNIQVVMTDFSQRAEE